MSDVTITPSTCKLCDLEIPNFGERFCNEQCRDEFDYIQTHGHARACENADCGRIFKTMGALRFCGQCDPSTSSAAIHARATRRECTGSECRQMVASTVTFCSHLCFLKDYPSTYVPRAFIEVNG